jgi:hypothetical protein
VCVVESLFVHVTIPPTGTVTGLGAYALVVNVDAPTTITTGAPGVEEAGGVVGVGETVGEDVDPPQPNEMRSRATSEIENLMDAALTKRRTTAQMAETRRRTRLLARVRAVVSRFMRKSATGVDDVRRND